MERTSENRINNDVSSYDASIEIPQMISELEIFPNERQLLILLGQGKSIDQGAAYFGIDKSSIESTLKIIRNRIGVNTNHGILLAAMQNGIINPREMLPEDFTTENFNYLMPEQLEALDSYFDNHDLSSDEEIAASLGLSLEEYHQNLYRGFGVINAKSVSNAAVMVQAYREDLGISDAQHFRKVFRLGENITIEDYENNTGIKITSRELEVIRFRAKGLTNIQLASELGIVEKTVKKYITSLYEKLKVKTSTEAIANLINVGLLNISELLPDDYDPRIMGNISQIEGEVIKHLGITDDLNRNIALKLGTSEMMVKNRLFSIMRKIGAVSREQVLVFYLDALRRKQDEAFRRGEDPKLVNPFDWKVDVLN